MLVSVLALIQIFFLDSSDLSAKIGCTALSGSRGKKIISTHGIRPKKAPDRCRRPLPLFQIHLRHVPLWYILAPEQWLVESPMRR
jgi:hypothetical protein